MKSRFLHIENLTFSYENGGDLFSGLNLTFPEGWSGIAGPNGSGKSTLMNLIAGGLSPDSGFIRRSGTILYIDQVPQDVPDALYELLARTDSEALKIINILDLEYDWPYRWDSLSFGERKRCQVGAAAASRPDILLMDEPVNHLDRDARLKVADVMSLYGGIGIIISHDAELLDRFCGRMLFLPEAKIFPGGYTKAAAERRRLETEAEREWSEASKELSRLRREEAKRRSLAASQQARRSKKNLDLKDHDGRAKLDLVRISGKDGTGGKLLRQMSGTLRQAEARAESSRAPGRKPSGITFSGVLSGSDFLWRKEAGFIGYGGGSDRGVRHPELEIRPGARILVTGANGTGKSTLIKSIAAESPDISWLLPQEFSDAEQMKLRECFSLLGSGARGRVVSSVCRLGSNPEYFLESGRWSPGEAKKLAAAIAIETVFDRYSLIILDEPMNHLDICSKELLKEAIDSFPGAVLAVSHESSLADGWNAEIWHLSGNEDGASLAAE